MYVACDSLTFVPYTQLFTRICGGDDLLRGMSSFTVEMSELKNIIVRADDRSLVLGDEICSGTESTSALSIVSAGLIHLDSVEASYVFATHLHDIVKVPSVTDLKRLRMMHLSCELDRDTGRLVYGRKLCNGPGSTSYGLDVCRALKMPAAFLRIAQGVRHGLVGSESGLVSTKRSRYNVKKFVDTCQRCGERATETHHRVPQAEADADGFLKGGFHKNALHNLEVLCVSCHQAEHH
jgi:DNA mismatch repair protein MutS